MNLPRALVLFLAFLHSSFGWKRRVWFFGKEIKPNHIRGQHI